eukprot:GEMP01012129.1.p1 GENE.GEMP01012129.1~~GEMP01012129.1.p1  ORF type:complete len:663 (+),score=189.72 GEMP01012129.1:182-2170(+)
MARPPTLVSPSGRPVAWLRQSPLHSVRPGTDDRKKPSAAHALATAAHRRGTPATRSLTAGSSLTCLPPPSSNRRAPKRRPDNADAGKVFVLPSAHPSSSSTAAAASSAAAEGDAVNDTAEIVAAGDDGGAIAGAEGTQPDNSPVHQGKERLTEWQRLREEAPASMQRGGRQRAQECGGASSHRSLGRGNSPDSTLAFAVKEFTSLATRNAHQSAREVSDMEKQERVVAWNDTALHDIQRGMVSTEDMEAELARLVEVGSRSATRCWKCCAPSPFTKLRCRGLGHELQVRYENKIRDATDSKLRKATEALDLKFAEIQDNIRQSLESAIMDFTEKYREIREAAEKEFRRAVDNFSGQITDATPPPIIQEVPGMNAEEVSKMLNQLETQGTAKLDGMFADLGTELRAEHRQMRQVFNSKMAQTTTFTEQLHSAMTTLDRRVDEEAVRSTKDTKESLRRSESLTAILADDVRRTSSDHIAALAEVKRVLADHIASSNKQLEEQTAGLQSRLDFLEMENARRWEDHEIELEEKLNSKATKIEVKALRHMGQAIGERESKRMEGRLSKLHKHMLASVDKVGAADEEISSFEMTKLNLIHTEVRELKTQYKEGAEKMWPQMSALRAYVDRLQLEVSEMKAQVAELRHPGTSKAGSTNDADTFQQLALI